MSNQLSEKEIALRARLSALPRAAVAFSGGVDSALLLRVALDEVKGGVVALVADGVFLGEEERDAAGTLADAFGADARFVPFDPLALDDLRLNPPDRCYRCKKHLMTLLLGEAEKAGCPALLDGTNHDDLSDDRPGLRALRELGVVSPLAEAGLDKEEVRNLSRRLGVDGHDRPALACLATRFPFGAELTADRLRRVDVAENYLRDLGFATVRVRDFDGVATIELGDSDFYTGDFIFVHRKEIAAVLRELGFERVVLDLEGYRRGGMNRTVRD